MTVIYHNKEEIQTGVAWAVLSLTGVGGAGLSWQWSCHCCLSAVQPLFPAPLLHACPSLLSLTIFIYHFKQQLCWHCSLGLQLNGRLRCFMKNATGLWMIPSNENRTSLAQEGCCCLLVHQGDCSSSYHLWYHLPVVIQWGHTSTDRNLGDM